METSPSEIKELYHQIMMLQLRIAQLEGLVIAPTQGVNYQALKKAKAKGLDPYPYMGKPSQGSLDFYRLVDLMDNLGLL